MNSISPEEKIKIGETISLLKNHSLHGRRLVDIPQDNYHDGKIIWKNIYAPSGECRQIFGVLRQTENGWICLFVDQLDTYVMSPQDIVMTV